MLPDLYDLQGDDLIELGMYTQTLVLLNNQFSENRSWATLTEQEILSIEEISLTSEGSAGAMSQSILEAYFNKHFDRCRTLQGEASYKSHEIDANMLSDSYGFTVTVQPDSS